MTSRREDESSPGRVEVHRGMPSGSESVNGVRVAGSHRRKHVDAMFAVGQESKTSKTGNGRKAPPG